MAILRFLFVVMIIMGTLWTLIHVLASPEKRKALVLPFVLATIAMMVASVLVAIEES